MLSSGPAAADGDADGERQTLRGLVGFEILVEEMSVDIERLGLYSADIYNDVARHLDQAGIRVLTHAQREKYAKTGTLYVRVSTLHDRIGRYFFCLELQVRQRVQLRTDDRRVDAWTWETPTRITVVADDKVQEILEVIRTEVKKFIADYRGANAEKAQRSP
jgi:hypothetical protein